MPAQPAWFHRLDEILSALRSMTSTHLDRAAHDTALPATMGRGFRRPGRCSVEKCKRALQLRC